MVTATISRAVRTSPAATPRDVKRAPSVTTGIANQLTAGLPAPPESAIDAAITTCERIQAPAITSSGCSAVAIVRSAIAKPTIATTSGMSVHQPIQCPLISSAPARIAKAIVRTGLSRRSMSTTRSRSASSRHSQELREEVVNMRVHRPRARPPL